MSSADIESGANHLHVEAELDAGRLFRLTVLASLSLSRSEGWRRWLLLMANGAAADALRTSTVPPKSPEREGALAVRGVVDMQ